MKETTTWRDLFGERFDRVDRWLTRAMARRGTPLLRVSIGLVFFWFGALKLFPGASPAAALVVESWGFLEASGIMPMRLFMILLGLWEMLIGLGFITGQFLRVVILLMALQMIGAVSPVVLQPGAVWRDFPFVLTLEGQYIVKNVVLIAAAFVIGGTVRGGGLAPEPEIEPRDVGADLPEHE
jgi:uncharacterized membrane protein YkgB